MEVAVIRQRAKDELGQGVFPGRLARELGDDPSGDEMQDVLIGEARSEARDRRHMAQTADAQIRGEAQRLQPVEHIGPEPASLRQEIDDLEFARDPGIPSSNSGK